MPNEPLPLESRSLLVLYASVTGTAIDISERIARRGRRDGWSVAVKGITEFDRNQLLTEPLIVFVLPTTGNGTAPPAFTPLWTSLLHPALPSDFLEDLRFAVFGLGDSSYAKYNWTAKKLSRRLEGLGALPVIERGEGDDQNEWGVESTFPKWLEEFYKAIDPLYRTPPGFTTLSLDDIPPSRIRLTKVESDLRMSSLNTSGPAVNGNSTLSQVQRGKQPMWWPDVSWGRLVKMERVTQKDWYQDVRSIQLQMESPTDAKYEAGDVMEIKPENSSEMVEIFLSSIGWTTVADQVYTVEATSSDQPLPPHLPPRYQTTIRQLLTTELDISCVPRLSFFEWLAVFSEGDMKEKLRWFCDPEGQDDLNDYTLRPKRTIVEVMYEFRAAKVPPEYIFDLLPPMRPRAFSIACSPHTCPGQVEVLVAIVQYKTILSVPRRGLCTSYLSSLKEGSKIPVRFEKGLLTLPPGAQPLIMVGPGTGVAPFRALMQERRRIGAKENLLFFGCRSTKADYYYESEWQSLVNESYLILDVAASRDQEEKDYVQHHIPQYADLIWDYLNRQGLIYICGSSTAMPKAVKKVFLKIFAAKSCLGQADAETEKQAEQMWDDLEKAGRIKEETWG